VSWAEVSPLVATTVDRVATLVEGLADLDRPGVGTWTAGDVAAHLVHMVEFDALAAAGVPGAIEDLASMPGLTAALVAGEADRDPASLARRLRGAAARLAGAAEQAPPGPREWIGGVALPVEGIGAHVVSEALLHGLDLARAGGRRWSLPAPESRLALDGFLFPVLADPRSHGLALDRQAVAGVRASYELVVRGGRRWFLRFDGGTLAVTLEPPAGRLDCRISADPAALLAVVWGRTGQGSQIARGKLWARGPKPWLGMRLTSYFRTI